MFFSVCDSYIAVIGDIIRSKKIVSRNEVQNILKKVLNNINEKYKEDIASNFMITLGDEFQGLLKCGKNTMNIISEIEVALLPVKLRFGIGIGMINTEIYAIPLGADGPAYYNAREMINELKKKENQYKESHSNIMIASGWDEQTDILLNSILSLCSTLKNKWTRRQTEIINCYLASGSNQYKTAENLNITQSSVNKALDNSSYYSYKKALDIVSLALSEIKVKF